MSYFHRSGPGDTLEEEPTRPRASGSRLAELGDRLARAMRSLERGPLEPPALVEDEEEGYGDTEAIEPVGDALAPAGPEQRGRLRARPAREEPDPDEGRFPVAPFGYNRTAVDVYLSEVERELEQLRGTRPAPEPSIDEELARLGEQTASILVTAHDQATLTTRRAEERAERTLAEAAEQAQEMVADAERRLRELDAETDSVWQERRRLIEDVRTTARSLLSLAADALDRFPEEEQPVAGSPTEEWSAPAHWPPAAQWPAAAPQSPPESEPPPLGA